MPSPNVNKLLTLCVGATFWMLAAGPTSAAPIAGLFSTGVDDQGAVRATNTGLVDLHYVVTGTAYSLKDANWGGPWLHNTATAGWLAPFYAGTNSWSYDAGHYIINTLFTIAAGEDASSAGFTAKVASDNGVAVSLNGHALGNGGPLNSFTTVTASQFFVSGLNTLSFDVTNSFCGSGCQNPAGLIVDITESHISAQDSTGGNVPEPATLALAAAALMACFGASGRERGLSLARRTWRH